MARPASAALIALVALWPGWLGAETITVSQLQAEHLGIKLGEARSAALEAIAQLPATVVPAANARTAATAPFAGTVVRSHVLPGQRVSAGDALATLASRELLDTLSQLAQSEAELQAAEAVAQRRRTLAAKSIYSTSYAEEAEAQVAKIRAVIEKHKRATTIGGISLGEGGQYTIRSPAAGRIVEVHAMAGETLQAMAAAATIDVGEGLWLEAFVPAQLIGSIKPGDKVQVGGAAVEGTVIAVGGSLDKATRSARLLASLPSGGVLVAGQLVTITLFRPAVTGALEVPASALTQIGERHAVFVRRADGFEVRTVEVRGRTPAVATVAGGLAAGELIALSGIPQLETLLEGQ